MAHPYFTALLFNVSVWRARSPPRRCARCSFLFNPQRLHRFKPWAILPLCEWNLNTLQGVEDNFQGSGGDTDTDDAAYRNDIQILTAARLRNPNFQTWTVKLDQVGDGDRDISNISRVDCEWRKRRHFQKRPEFVFKHKLTQPNPANPWQGFQIAGL
jgi:hypothetical protein